MLNAIQMWECRKTEKLSDWITIYIDILIKTLNTNKWRQDHSQKLAKTIVILLTILLFIFFVSVCTMVETAGQTTSKSPPAFVPHQFFGNMFLGEGFKPVCRPRGTIQATPTGGGSASLFTIDSILAPRPKVTSSPQRPLLHNPNIHLGHIAAAAGGFGPGSADFLGERSNNHKYIINYY